MLSSSRGTSHMHPFSPRCIGSAEVKLSQPHGNTITTKTNLSFFHSRAGPFSLWYPTQATATKKKLGTVTRCSPLPFLPISTPRKKLYFYSSGKYARDNPHGSFNVECRSLHYIGRYSRTQEKPATTCSTVGCPLCPAHIATTKQRAIGTTSTHQGVNIRRTALTQQLLGNILLQYTRSPTARTTPL